MIATQGFSSPTDASWSFEPASGAPDWQPESCEACGCSHDVCSKVSSESNEFVSHAMAIVEEVLHDALGDKRSLVTMDPKMAQLAQDAIRVGGANARDLGLPQRVPDDAAATFRDEMRQLIAIAGEPSRLGWVVQQYVGEMLADKGAMQDPLCNDGVLTCIDNGCNGFNIPSMYVFAGCMNVTAIVPVVGPPIPFVVDCKCFVVDLKLVKWWQWLILIAVAALGIYALLRAGAVLVPALARAATH